MAQPFFIARDGQSLFDLALMAYGDYSKVFQLVKENPSLFSVSNTNFVGQKIYYTPENTNDRSTLQLTNKVLVTGLPVYTQPVTKYILQEDGFGFDLEDGSGKIEME